MKITLLTAMTLDNYLKKILLFLFFSAASFGEYTKEVAFLFLEGDDQQLSNSIDKNIWELASVNAQEKLKISILRVNSNQALSYFPQNHESYIPVKEVIFNHPLEDLNIPGKLNKWSSNIKDLFGSSQLVSFMKNSFSNPDSVKFLFIYGHGLGPKGFKEISLGNFQKALIKSLPFNLDVLWFNSCFMGSIEVATELSSLASYLAFSQESEFQAGSPLKMLDLIQENDIENSLIDMGLLHLSSYSKKFQGSQSFDVETSPATLSIIETIKLKPLIEKISQIAEQTDEAISLIESFHQHVNLYQMQDLSRQVDLGHLLRFFFREGSPMIKDLSEEALGFLEIDPHLPWEFSPWEQVDFVRWIRRDKDSVILFNGITYPKSYQQALRYTGLSIYNPASNELDFSYPRLKFSRQTRWSNL